MIFFCKIFLRIFLPERNEIIFDIFLLLISKLCTVNVFLVYREVDFVTPFIVPYIVMIFQLI